MSGLISTIRTKNVARTWFVASLGVTCLFYLILLNQENQDSQQVITYTYLSGVTHEWSQLFEGTKRVLVKSKCDKNTLRSMDLLFPDASLFYSECNPSPTSDFDTVFIDVSTLKSNQLVDTLRQFQSKPTKYIVVYKETLYESRWNEDVNMVGDLIDDFLEEHVRWQIRSEPYQEKSTDKLVDRVFILEGETQRSWDLIQKHQFPISCDDQDYFVGKYWYAGYGSYMAVTFPALEGSTLNNKTLLLTGNWSQYSDLKTLPKRAQKFCQTNSPDCYMLKLTNCTLKNALASFQRHFPDNQLEEWKEIGKNHLINESFAFADKHPLVKSEQVLPRSKNSSHFIDAETAPYMLQFNKLRRYIREEIYRRKKNIGLGNVYAGIHIRHGDKHKEAGAFFHLSEYVAELKRLIDKMCNQSCAFDRSKPVPLYVMTDDASELNSTTMFPEFKFLFLNSSRHTSTKAAWMFTEEQMKNRTEIFMTLATEMSIITNAKAFVGTARSALSGVLEKLYYQNKGLSYPKGMHSILKGVYFEKPK